MQFLVFGFLHVTAALDFKLLLLSLNPSDSGPRGSYSRPRGIAFERCRRGWVAINPDGGRGGLLTALSRPFCLSQTPSPPWRSPEEFASTHSSKNFKCHVAVLRSAYSLRQGSGEGYKLCDITSCHDVAVPSSLCSVVNGGGWGSRPR